ncbi:MAG: hypothetical protein J6E31_04820 [Pyramidobacter sp.]|nr:hypothetical protein [Pyramidobacter sp.]
MTALPSTAAASEEIRGRALKADFVLVPVDPMTKELLKKKPIPGFEPKTVPVVTYKGDSNGTREGVVRVTLSLDPDRVRKAYPDEALPDHLNGAFSFFDMRFMLAYQALWEKAEQMNIPIEKRYFSVAQLCRHMTAGARPAASQMRKVRNTAEKLMYVKMQIDASGEAHLRNHSNSRVAAFLPAEVLKGTMGGNTTDLIHPLAEAPLFSFVKERRQMTTVPIGVFNESPLSLTESSINIEYVLLAHISGINYSAKMHPVIKIETFLQACGIVPPADESAAAAARFRQQKKRALMNAEKWLAHLRKCGLIEGFGKADGRFQITPKSKGRSKTKSFE